MRSNKEKMWDNIMNWDTEFQVQIENMENMENMDAAPPGSAAHNLVGSVDYMSFMGTAMHLQCPKIPEVWMPV
jgi:hypothetical protein